MRKNKKGTRIERYSVKNGIKRKIKKISVKKILKNIIRNIIYLMVGFVYSIYLLIRAFNNLVAKFFMRLPRLMKVTIIYLLVANLGLGVYELGNCFKDYINSFKIENTIILETKTMEISKNIPTSTEIAQIETKQQSEVKCTLEHETACKIKKKAEEYGIDWKVAVSISAWETGYWKSNLYTNKNNVGGLYCNGSFLSYATLDEGIEDYVSNLKRLYFDMGLNTIEKIQPKYCPVGAKNDPTGLNKNWLGGVTKIYNSLEK